MKRLSTKRLLLLAGILLLDGCALTAPAIEENTGLQVSPHGRYSGLYPASLTQATTAAKEALQEIGMSYDAVVSRTPTQVLIQGVTSKHQVVQVTLDAHNARQTEVSIHSGYYGNKRLSLRFQRLLAEDLQAGEKSH